LYIGNTGEEKTITNKFCSGRGIRWEKPSVIREPRDEGEIRWL
jgi:hypothetical protein